MTCRVSGCHAELPPNARFCPYCGVPAQQPCPNPACGSHARGEWIPVTVAETVGNGLLRQAESLRRAVPDGPRAVPPLECPVCGLLLRFCPRCGRLYDLHTRICVNRTCGGAKIIQRVGGHFAWAGDFGRRWAVRDEFCRFAELDGVVTPQWDESLQTLRGPLRAAVAAHSRLFIVHGQTLTSVREFDGTEVYHTNLGPIADGLTPRGIAVVDAYVYLLLESEAVALDVNSGQVAARVPGAFTDQLVTDSLWCLASLPPPSLSPPYQGGEGGGWRTFICPRPDLSPVRALTPLPLRQVSLLTLQPGMGIFAAGLDGEPIYRFNENSLTWDRFWNPPTGEILNLAAASKHLLCLWRERIGQEFGQHHVSHILPNGEVDPDEAVLDFIPHLGQFAVTPTHVVFADNVEHALRVYPADHLSAADPQRIGVGETVFIDRWLAVTDKDGRTHLFTIERHASGITTVCLVQRDLDSGRTRPLCWGENPRQNFHLLYANGQVIFFVSDMERTVVRAYKLVH